MTYFTLPLYGTPYHRFCHLGQGGVVVAVDISRPEGEEVPIPHGVKFRLEPIQYGGVNSKKLSNFTFGSSVKNGPTKVRRGTIVMDEGGFYE